MLSKLIAVSIVIMFLAGCGNTGGSTTNFVYGSVTPSITPANLSGNSVLNSGVDGTLAASLALTVTSTGLTSTYSFNSVSLNYCKYTDNSKCITISQLDSDSPTYPINLDTAFIKSKIIEFDPTPASYFATISFTVRENKSGMTAGYTNQHVAIVNFQ
jgi:hypothetical protein